MSTSDRDRYRLQLWRTELGANTALITVTADHIHAALTRIGKRTSASTGNTALGVLKTYLTWAANMGLMPNHSHRTVRRLKEPSALRHKRAWWTSEEVDLALRCAANDLHQPTATLLVACGCFLGLRVEEIIMQRWQDLSLDALDPRTQESKPVCHVTPNNGWQPKDGEARDVPICAPLLAILKEHRRDNGYLLEAEPHRPGRPRNGTGWIYRYDPKKVWARVMRSVVATEGRAITMYGMRHTFASNLLIAGVSDVKVSRWLGHADTRMVHRHYGHLLSYDDDINALKRPEGPSLGNVQPCPDAANRRKLWWLSEHFLVSGFFGRCRLFLRDGLGAYSAQKVTAMDSWGNATVSSSDFHGILDPYRPSWIFAQYAGSGRSSRCRSNVI